MAFRLHEFACLLALTTLVSCQHIVSRHPSVDFAQRNLNTIKRIYNTTIYPHNQDFVTHGAVAIPSGLFNVNASGRITPIGNFTGFEDSVEYFFGLTPTSQAPLWATWTSFEVVSFTSGCPEVASSVVYGKTTGVNPNASTFGQHVTTIKQVRQCAASKAQPFPAQDKLTIDPCQIVFWRFDDAGSVIFYDAWIPSLKKYARLQFGVQPSPAFHAASIERLCTATQALCTGANIQYKTTAGCIKSLSTKPFGDWDEVWGDNVVCRTLHVELARLRPAVSVSHNASASNVTDARQRSTVPTWERLGEANA